MKANQLPSIWRLAACVALIAQFCATPIPLLAAGAAIPPGPAAGAPLPPATAPNPPTVAVKPNTTPPENAAHSGRAEFTAAPSDAEFLNCRLFEEPLIAIGGKSTAAENAALAAAILAFQDRKSPEDFTALTAFLKENPASVWRAALNLNLGTSYARACYHGRAFQALIAAWDASKSESALPARGLADRAVGELSEIYASLGCGEALAALLEEVKAREFLGSARQKIVGAREMLNYISYRPDHAFNCGPLVLDFLRGQGKPGLGHLDMLFDPEEDVVGRNVTQLAALSARAGLPMVAVKRPAGEPFPVPSMVHWKVRHFDALLERQGNRYRLHNPYVKHDIWVSQAALEEETTGYVMVAADQVPKGWTVVPEAEGKGIWGGCHTGTCDPACTDDSQLSTDCPGGAMAAYSLFFFLVNLHISDTPVGYQPPRGPGVWFKVNYNHREAYQPASFNYSNLGQLWAFSFLSYVNDQNSTSLDSTVTIYEQGGGTRQFSFATGSNVSAANLKDSSILSRTVNGTAVTSYTRAFLDGSQYVYNVATSTVGGSVRKVFLKQIVDAQSNALTLSYDAQFRLTGITDALGQVTTFAYGLAADIYKITKVTDPFGRFCTFTYNAALQLASITDPIGIVSQFSYQGSFIQTLTTPYGNTTFSAGEMGSDVTTWRWLQVVDPTGAKERVEYYQNDNPVLPASDPAFPNGPQTLPNTLNIDNEFLDTRNSFYWDKKAMMDAPGDYTKAHIYQWLHDSAYQQITDILETEKAPLESRVWYNYPGQVSPYYGAGTIARPNRVARLLDGKGNMQLAQASYNAQGNVTQSIDPAGRTNSYVYDATGIDLLQVLNTTGGRNDVLAVVTYTNAQHLVSIHKPLTITDASGQTTTLAYNAQGQLLTQTVVRNGVNETTTLAYDGNGYLQTITGPMAGAAVSFAYDSYGRMRMVTDSEGYTVTQGYDAINRPTSVTYPDGTYEQSIYNILDLGWQKDRLNRWTTYTYDADRRLVSAMDPLGRTTKLGYCACGALVLLIDAAGNATGWTRDVQKRPTAKIYSDGTRQLYFYDLAGRLASVTDAKGQIVSYAYNPDNTLQQKSYARAQIPTANVSFTYDANYRRVLTMQDGTGQTIYAYKPYSTANPPAVSTGVGRLLTETGPLLNSTIAYGYDELGRVNSLSINGAANSTSAMFDSLGRTASVTNPLGTFGYGYVNTTSRLSTVTYPNGQSTAFTYFPNIGDQRLQQIKNLTPGNAILSKFDYTYNAVGNIQTWTQQTDANTPTAYAYQYDAADQLLAAIQANTATQAVLHQYAYGYDLAANRSSEQIDNQVNSATSNGLNQLTATQGGGPLRFSGTLSEPAKVTVGGTPATVSGNTFIGSANVTPGNTQVVVSATNNSGKTNSHTYQVATTGSPAQAFKYDPEGNTLSDGQQTYEWDAENRMTAINYIGTQNRTEFTYDGLGRRTAIIEKTNGAVTSAKKFVFVGLIPAEERDATNNVTKRFFSQGEQTAGAVYFFTRDHLDSVREMTDTTGAIRARYDYAPYGMVTKLSGALDADFGYTGHYYHWPTGKYLSRTREYDAHAARWLSRDLVAEKGGTNLYRYVANNPIRYFDPLGLHLEIMFMGDMPPIFENAVEFAKPIAEMGRDIVEASNEHHSDPNFMGGAPKQPTTTMPTSEHIELHRLMNNFFRGIKDIFGNDMCPRRGNPGSLIRENFTRPERLDALRDFYKGPGSRFTDAASDFFAQHSDLLTQMLNPHPSLD